MGSNAAVKICGIYDDACETSGTLTRFYCVLVVCLQNIANCTGFIGMHRSEANALKDKLLDYEVILTTFIYLRIFKYTTPLSDYLQTSGLGYVQAWRQVSVVKKNIAAISRDFPQVLETVSSFVQWASKQFEDLYVEVGIIPSLKEKSVT